MSSTQSPQRHIRRAHILDAVVVALALPFVLLASFDLLNVGGAGSPRIWAFLIVAPLAIRRRNPVASAVIIFAIGAIKVVIGPALVFPADLAVLIALYSVTLYGPKWANRTAIAGVGLGALGIAARTFAAFAFMQTSVEALATIGLTFVMVAVMGLATWGFALLRRARAETLEALRDRADRLERERDQQTQLATAAERARIAREMHDVVAHSLSIVVAQADGGRYAATQKPEAAVEALDTISQTGRAALADMRRILGVLRDNPAHAADPAQKAASPAHTAGATGPAHTAGISGPADRADPAPLAPQPQANELDELIKQVRSAGMRISVVEVGQARLLPPGMALSVYRIVQESLTNVLKHAGPDPTVTVVRRWDTRMLTLDITDDGRGAASDNQDPTGHGIVGMRERVALFQGTIEAGPRDGGGFRVHVELPLPQAAPPEPAAPPAPRQ